MSRAIEIEGIERLEGRGITAKVTDTGKLYSTYTDFAEAVGYPDATHDLWVVGNSKVRELDARGDEVFTVLAKGFHGSQPDVIIYVIESADGKRFLVGADGLEIIENDGAPKSLELRGQAEELLAELRRQAYAEGYEQAKKDAEKDAEIDKVWEDITNSPKSLMESPQQKRDRIVEQAKADLENVKTEWNVRDDIPGGKMRYIHGYKVCSEEFIVNKDKRTIVSILRWNRNNSIVSRGIAKCSPGDCFNAHIGKAIALRRALELEVPDEYLNAPQPTEVRVGDVVDTNSSYGVMEVGDEYDLDARVIIKEVFEVLGGARIIDDSESIAP